MTVATFERILKEFAELREFLEQRFDRVDAHFDRIELILDRSDARMDSIPRG
jgi:hypothetical protein